MIEFFSVCGRAIDSFQSGRYQRRIVNVTERESAMEELRERRRAIEAVLEAIYVTEDYLWSAPGTTDTAEPQSEACS